MSNPGPIWRGLFNFVKSLHCHSIVHLIRALGPKKIFWWSLLQKEWFLEQNIVFGVFGNIWTILDVFLLRKLWNKLKQPHWQKFGTGKAFGKGAAIHLEHLGTNCLPVCYVVQSRQRLPRIHSQVIVATCLIEKRDSSTLRVLSLSCSMLQPRVPSKSR